MKTPRITDFDPDAKTSSLKSPLDKMPTIINLGKKESDILSGRETARPPDEPTGRPPDRVAARGGLIRRGFDWYADQLRALKKLSLEEQMRGNSGSMSEMVRDALDEYLKKRAIQK